MLARLLRIAALLTCGLTEAWAGASATPDLSKAPPMMFYVVQGATDACGQGCSRWIEVEGAIDSQAAGRFRRFLSRRYAPTLPIYFHSPGGNLDQAIAMGGMLHEKPTVARVGRTVVRECGFEAQDSEACLKLKQSGRELHGDLFTRNAMCVSACPYLMLGAASREIAPDAMLGVHSAKVVLSFRGGFRPTPAMVAAATERERERGQRLLSAYFAKLRADAALLSLVKTVKFENMHVLTRDEIFRFGIDRRDLVETPWSLETGGRIGIGKAVAQRVAGESVFRTTRWRLVCLDNERFELNVLRAAAPQAAPASLVIEDRNAKLHSLDLLSAKTSPFLVWGKRMAGASVRSLADLPQFELSEFSPGMGGQDHATRTRLSNQGLSGALDRLAVGCAAPKEMASPSTVVSDAAN